MLGSVTVTLSTETVRTVVSHTREAETTQINAIRRNTFLQTDPDETRLVRCVREDRHFVFTLLAPSACAQPPAPAAARRR